MRFAGCVSLALPRAIVLMLVLLSMASESLGQGSLLDRLPGFDAQRLRTIAQRPDADEIARLIYRLKRIQPESLQQRANTAAVVSNPDRGAGDIVTIEGTIVDIKRSVVSPRLHNPLSIEQIFDLTLRVDLTGTTAGDHDHPTVRCFTDQLPIAAQKGDTISVVGVAIDDSVHAVAAADLSWTPLHFQTDGHRLLSNAGFNLARLDALIQRDQRPLTTADNQSFYAMMRAAAEVPASFTGLSIQPVTDVLPLLTSPRQTIGDAVRLPVQLTQSTRIELTQSDAIDTLGQDHYFQTDGVVILTGAEVVIRPADTSTGSSAGTAGGNDIVVGNRIPISVVSIDPPPTVGTDVVTPINLDAVLWGFFYRNWSYESELTTGTGVRGYALIICATNLVLRRPPAIGDVDSIGRFAAAGLIAGLLATAMASVWWARADRSARRRLPDTLPKDVSLSPKSVQIDPSTKPLPGDGPRS